MWEELIRADCPEEITLRVLGRDACGNLILCVKRPRPFYPNNCWAGSCCASNCCAPSRRCR